MKVGDLALTKLRSGYRTYAARGVVVVGSIAAFAAGCGGNRTADLAGKVTIGGKPVPAEAEGTIFFAPIDPKAGDAVATVITNSAYQASDVPAGEVSVTFEITQAVGPVKKSERTGAEYQETKSLIPPSASGGIRLNVAGDNANQDFDL
jgi:hypothetical protein